MDGRQHPIYSPITTQIKFKFADDVMKKPKVKSFGFLMHLGELSYQVQQR